MNLDEFLSSLSDVKKEDRLQVVLGNEAADLDSMASSLLYAYYLREQNKERRPLSLPVINIPRADFGLRTEAVWLFQEAGVDINLLVFSDEIDLPAMQAADRLELVLVDHNKLPAAWTDWEASVVEILDHHADEGLYSHAKRAIAPVGSCATLVGERFLEFQPQAVNERVGKLLLGTILLDTVNLDPEAKRSTPRDEETVSRLLSTTHVDRKALFDRLQSEKFNVSSLSTRDILRKDYKEYTMGTVHCGISSALLPLAEWVAKDTRFEDSFRAYAEERHLDVLLAMCAYTRPEFKRELAVYATDQAMRRRVVRALNSAEMGLQELQIASRENAPHTDFYSQTNAGGSRKKVQPILAGELSSNP